MKIKFKLLILALVALFASGVEAKKIGDNLLLLGNDVAENIVIRALNGKTSNFDELFHDDTSGEWKKRTAGVVTGIGAGPPAFATVTKTSSTTLLTSGEDHVLGDATSGDLTLTLPAASGNSGLTYKISKIDSSVNDLIIDGNASETIDGDLTLTIINQFESMTITSDGTNWFRVSGGKGKDSSVRGHTCNGKGSTSTSVFRFTTIVEDIGNALTLVQSSTNGDVITVEEDGIYSASFIGSAPGDSFMGISQGLTGTVTIGIQTLATANRIGLSRILTNGNYRTVAWTGFLVKGTEIRFQGEANPTNPANPGRCGFTVAKIGAR